MTIETTPEAGKPNVGEIESTDEVRIIRAGNSRLADAGAYASMPTVDGNPIVESGSNSDGHWVRFADGTQIAWKENVDTDFDVNIAAGDVFQSSDIRWDFPQSVTNNRVVFTAVRRVGGPSLSLWSDCNNYPATSAANLRVYSATSETGVQYNLIGFVVGRWF